MEKTLILVKEDSLKKRYLYKVATNMVGFLISLVTQAIIPRALGPASYGSFSFLSDFFRQVVGFFDAGTSVGFYSKLSCRLNESGLIRFYWYFVGLVSVLTLFLVGFLSLIGLGQWLWPEQATRYIWMATLLALLVWCTQIINNIVDAYGLTVRGEVARIWQKTLGLGLILLMFWFNWFSLTDFFMYNYIIQVFLCLIWWQILRINGVALFPRIRLSVLAVKNYVGEFYSYAAPLLMAALFGLFFGVLDRWLLQKIAGSVEQGFYGLSYQIGAICFMFTSAMTVLLTREFSKSFSSNNLERMRVLFQRYIPMLYSVAAFLGVFVAAQAGRVSLMFGGDRFQGATLSIFIMSFYPIHQTYGQLSGAVFFATGQTKLYRNITIGVGLLGLPIILWLLGPKKWLGLELGATGLAYKTVLIQFIGVNLQLWFNARLLHLSFWKFLWHQGYSLALLAVAATLATKTVDMLVQNTVLAFLITGCVYILGCVAIAFCFPHVFGITRTELVSVVSQMRSRIVSTWRS